MRFSIFIILFSLIGLLNGQNTSVIYRNDFSEGEVSWPEYVMKNARTFKKDGYYNLEHFANDESWYSPSEILINPIKDWQITMSVRKISGDKQSAYGMVWGSRNLSNGYYFSISETGYFKIYKYNNDVLNDITDWKACNVINSNPRFNLLQIQNKSGKWLFLINNALVYEMNAQKFMGGSLALHCVDVANLQMDYIEVNQNSEPIDLIENADSFGEKEHLGSHINSEHNELQPLISHDGKMLFVTRSGHPGNYGTEKKEDVWCATLQQDSTWTALKNVGPPLNNEAYNFVISVSPDNNTLLVGNTYDAKGNVIGNGVSVTHRLKTGWSIPKPLKIKNFYNYNSFNEACLSPNGRVLLITLERDDTYGLKDIYACFLQNDSTWSEPKNIGANINTFAEETSPFLAADGKTLYFSTAGWPGYGKNDIFVSRRLDETWKKWSKPKNLGLKVNTKNWDAYYTVQASGEYAYVVSNVKEEANNDIYRIRQNKQARPLPVGLISGKVYHYKTKEPLKAHVWYNELGNKKTLGEANSNPETGAYSLVLPVGKKYSYHAFKEGYIAIHNNIDLSTQSQYKEFGVDLYLVPIAAGETVLLNNLFFVANKFDLLPESFPELDMIVDLMKKYPKMKIEIGGHTSKNNSTEKFNLELSQNRAKAVKLYLISKGIQENRILTVGYGCSKPIYAEIDETHQSKNRRVELTILEK